MKRYFTALCIILSFSFSLARAEYDQRASVLNILAQGDVFILTDCSDARLLLEANNILVADRAEALVWEEQTEFWILRVLHTTETGTACLVCTFDYEGKLIDQAQIPIYETFNTKNSSCRVELSDELSIKTVTTSSSNPQRMLCYKTIFNISLDGEIEEEK